MMIKIFDAFAVLCWIQEEPGSSCINHLMEEAGKRQLRSIYQQLMLVKFFTACIRTVRVKLLPHFYLTSKERCFPGR